MKSFKRIVCFGVIISQVFGVAGSSAFGCNCKDKKGCKDYCYYDACFRSNYERGSSGRERNRQHGSYSKQEETKNLNINYNDAGVMPWKTRLKVYIAIGAVLLAAAGGGAYYIATMEDGEKKELLKDGVSIGARIVGNFLGGMSDGRRRYYW